jgi:hypothetical protein
VPAGDQHCLSIKTLWRSPESNVRQNCVAPSSRTVAVEHISFADQRLARDAETSGTHVAKSGAVLAVAAAIAREFHQSVIFKGTNMKKTLLATAVALAFGFTGHVMAGQPSMHSGGSNGGSGGQGTVVPAGADDGGVVASQGARVEQDSRNDSRNQSGQNNSEGDAKAYEVGAAAANNGGQATANLNNAFNTSKAVAMTKLHGSVSHNLILGVGNSASTHGSADGGKAYGGDGGKGIGGNAKSVGAKGGGAYGGDGGSGGSGGKGYTGEAETGNTSNGKNDAGRGGSGGDASSAGQASKPPTWRSNGMSHGGSGGSGSDGGMTHNTGGDGAAGGNADSGNANGGNASNRARGGAGGSGGGGGGLNMAGGGGNGGTANAGAGTGGAGSGGAGGNGGNVVADAGVFNMSNTMFSVGQTAAGIMVATQNSGLSSLIQQSINVQANMTLR